MRNFTDAYSKIAEETFGECILLILRDLPPDWNFPAAYITKCSRSSPSFTQCILDNIEKIRPYLAKGIPEMSVPPMEPLVIPKAQIRNTVFEDIELTNGTTFQVHNLNVTSKFDTIAADISLERIAIKAKYHINEHILVLQLRGNGSFQAVVNNLKVHAVYDLVPYQRKGKQYIEPKRHKSILTYQVSDVHFDNLFPERSELTVSTNKIINENIDTIMEEFKPGFDETALTIFQILLGRILRRFSVDDLLSE
ncbi:uncharacterized protein LOC108734133 [Agrilus planipennis]|uniref:Uncharacterized protein LOC108734133 n=1 Tax=Agrilus planipennis TaxID=224129 RepID=A0A1W4WLQ0_AGRPL|nr:uncharacterized protein LOC108734133 [Agrilus planipennis]